MAYRPVVRDGRIWLTRKLVDGVLEYARHWQGPVSLVVRPSDGPEENLDAIEVGNNEFDFDVEVINGSPIQMRRVFERAAVVLATIREPIAVDICREMKIPCVLVAENPWNVRFQQIRASVRNPLRRLRRYLGETRRCLRERAAVRKADGVQCNGTPAFHEFGTRNRKPLLYFDTRFPEALMPSVAAVEQRFESRRAGDPVRLAFSGRFVPIKGLDHVIRAAVELKRLGTRFKLMLCGGGEMEAALRKDIERLALQQDVILTGVLDFNTELVPLISRSVDLFVCCHLQGDPACTYLETMACGVPIVGYDNPAFRGIVGASGAGWTTPMRDPNKLARKITELASDPAVLRDHAVKALNFARQHSFERTFQRRVEHLREFAKSSGR